VKIGRLIRPLGVAMTAGQVAWAARQHWVEIPPERRRRLRELLRQSKGDPRRLSPAQRDEMRELVRGLELARLARRAARVATLGARRARK